MSLNHVRLSALIRDATFGVSIPGLALSVLLLIAIVYLRWNPCSRPYLNRVSFRLLTYALVAKLVLVFGVNGNKMEKYYITGSVILCSACNIPPLAYGKLGWYAETGTCWLRDPSPSIQLRWLLGTQVVWMLLMSTVEVIAFVIIVIFMMRHQARIRRLRVDALPHSASALASHLTTFKSSLPAHPIVRYRPMILRIDLIIYALRPLLYALLACTDPSFLRAIRSLFPNSSSSSSPSPSQLALPTLNMTAISSLSITDPPHSSDNWDKTIRVRQIAEAYSRDNYNQPTTTEEEAECDNVVVQI
ncbi:hypothetical protein DFH08DRAFT_818300 [Mycena albidolilacea]|uniref:Uncharacterized protein n=1 Tax=Mycena albidolilacea TaxID=1033008 RepID=A0AAD6ZH85_9AGAR|nr:hypothetical protein DFH08DRAFT_818300 [Mycena albidolilacea]